MLGFIFLILSGVVAVQTKPKQETFVPFITTQRKDRFEKSSASSASSASGGSSRNGVTGWFTRNILEPITGPRVPEHTVTDYYFFQIATLNDGSGQYLGIFNQWWVISELQEVTSSGASVGSGSPGNSSAYEAQAESRKQEASQAKIKKDYIGAGKLFVDAAKLYEKCGTQLNIMEAATAYEDAFKAYNMAKQTGPALQCLEHAARLFKLNERGGSRAARVYSQIGDLLKAQDAKKSAEMYAEAAELFRSESDGRALHTTIRQAEQLCIIHEYAKAFALYKDIIIPETMSQEILQLTTRDHIIKAIIAHLGASQGDWITFENDLSHFEDICGDFRSSRGLQVLKNMAKAEREHDAGAFQEACQEFDRLQSGGMADWQVGLLLQEKKKLEVGDLL